MEGKENKDKKVKVYRLFTTKLDGFEKVVKQYIHTQESGGLWAFVRDLSQSERFSAKAVQVDQTIMFKIVYNPKITDELYIEYGGNTYNITSINKKEHNHSDIVINANLILAPVFDEVRYEQY